MERRCCLSFGCWEQGWNARRNTVVVFPYFPYYSCLITTIFPVKDTTLAQVNLWCYHPWLFYVALMNYLNKGTGRHLLDSLNSSIIKVCYLLTGRRGLGFFFFFSLVQGRVLMLLSETILVSLVSWASLILQTSIFQLITFICPQNNLWGCH